MKIGLIGCGNMARSLARGWGQPVLCADPVRERAQALVDELGGEVFTSNGEVAAAADLVVLCHKPAQLQSVAGEVAPHAKAVASILAATPLGDLRAAYPGIPVYRFIPSLPVEVRQGAVVQARGAEQDPSLDAAVAGLSGGNQQKIALAKWLARECAILIVDEPTRGVDVGAKAEIHQLLDDLACQGMAILLISSELPEVMNLSRRILVMRDGAITGELQRSDFSQASLMRLMAGVS